MSDNREVLVITKDYMVVDATDGRAQYRDTNGNRHEALVDQTFTSKEEAYELVVKLLNEKFLQDNKKFRKAIKEMEEAKRGLTLYSERISHAEYMIETADARKTPPPKQE